MWNRLQAFQRLARVLQCSGDVVHLLGDVAEIAETRGGLLLGSVRIAGDGQQGCHRLSRFTEPRQRKVVIACQFSAQVLVRRASSQVECLVQQALAASNVPRGEVVVGEHVEHGGAMIRIVLELRCRQRLTALEQVADGDGPIRPRRISDQHVHEVRHRFTARGQLQSLVAFDARNARLAQCDGGCRENRQ